jgi:hypothetical protein
MKKLFLLLAFFTLLQYTHAPKEGISGQVLWLRDDQMSGPSKTIAPPLGVVREILIYNATFLKDAKQDDQFFSEINTELVTQTWSKDDGTFKVKLPPGEYSVFTRESRGLYAGMIDKNGCINCVVVKPKKYSWVAITIDYDTPY